MLSKVTDPQVRVRETFAGPRCQHATDGLHERGFTCAVGAEQPNARTGQDAPVDIAEHRRAAIAERYPIQANELAGANRRGCERELERTIDVRRSDVLHSLDRLDAALHLLRLRRLGTKSIDERLQMRHLPLLL